MRFKKAFRRRWVKALVALGLVFLALYLIPIPPVGSPVEELALRDSKFVEVEGVKIHYVDYGEGDTLFVLLHGFGASTFSWREISPNLSRYSRVVAFDRPGFGLTERVDPGSTRLNPYSAEGATELSCRFIKAIYRGEQRIVLIGHSAGGGLALLIALKCDIPVSALILIAPAWKPYEQNLGERLLYNLPLSDKYGPLLLRLYVGQLENVLYKAWYNKSLLTQGVLEGYKYPLKARDWDKGLYWLMKNRRFPDIKSKLSDIRADVLIIHGRDDEIVSLEHSKELNNLLVGRTRVELVVVDQCGHLPHEEKPDLVLSEILRFLGLGLNQ